jgi:phosphoglycolate phosphatase-like HAD superfamily hydrolase
VAVRSGVHSAERLVRHDPLVCLDHVRDLPAWMDRAGLLEHSRMTTQQVRT